MAFQQVDINQAAEWMWKADIREMPIADLIKTEVITNKLDYFSGLYENIKKYICN